MTFDPNDVSLNAQSDTSDTTKDLRHIATVMKASREARGLTQRELAALAGVSPGLVGQIETSRTRPSVSTLLKISRVLGLSLDALFQPTESDGLTSTAGGFTDKLLTPAQKQVVPTERFGFKESDSRSSYLSSTEHIDDHVVRSNARETITLEGGVQWELLTPGVDHNLSFMIVTYPPGTTSSTSRQLLRHDDDEYFCILEGVLQVRLAFEETTLYPGDAMSFDSSRPHRFENREAVQAVGIWAVARKDPVTQVAGPGDDSTYSKHHK
jgi:transcriptional regulator with XRE-family HTH domain